MRLREILRDISRIPEVHFKLGQYYLIAENEGRGLRCLLYHWRDYRFGGEPIKEVTKTVEELPGFLSELKEELGVQRVRVVRVW